MIGNMDGVKTVGNKKLIFKERRKKCSLHPYLKYCFLKKKKKRFSN